MKNEEQFDDLLRQKANSHEAPVPADAWGNIIQKRKRRRFIFFWWCLAGVLIAGSGSYIIYKTQGRNIDSTEIVRQNQLPTVNADKREKTQEENEKKTNESHKENNDTENKVDPKIANGGEENGSDKEIAENRKHEETIDSEKNQQDTKEKKKKINKNSTTATIENELGGRKNIADDKATTKQNEKNTERKIQPPSALAKSKSKSDSGSLLDKKHVVVVEGRKKKDVFRNIEKTAEIATTTDNETASEKDGFTISTQIKEDLVDVEKPTEKGVIIDVVKTIDDMNKVEKLVRLDTSFSIGNIDSLEPLQIALSNKKAMKSIAPTNSSKWWVDISATPFASISTSKTISQLNRTTQMSGYVAEYTANKVKISQEPSIVYGIALRKNMNKKWALGLGFQYQQIKEKISMSGTETHTSTTVVQRLEQNNNGPILVNDTITNVATGTRTIDALNSYTLMSVPIFVQYHLLNKRNWLLDWNVGGFVNISRRYSNSVDGLFIEQNNTNVKPESQSKVGFDLFTEIRISNGLTKKIFVFAAPGFRYNLSEYKMPNMFKYTFLHQAGLSLGLSIKL